MTEDLDDLVASLWARMAPALVADVQRLDDLVTDLEQHGPPPAPPVPVSDGAAPPLDPRWREVRDLAHRLAGALGSLGQREAGSHAVALEELTAGRPTADAALLATIRPHVDLLQARVREAGGERP